MITIGVCDKSVPILSVLLTFEMEECQNMNTNIDYKTTLDDVITPPFVLPPLSGNSSHG